MKKYKLIILSCITLLFCSCGNSTEKYLTTKSGIKYKYFKKGEGDTLSYDQVLVMNLTYKSSSDSVLFSSLDNPVPSAIKYTPEDKAEGTLMEGLNMLKKGDSVIFKLNAKDFYEKTIYRPIPVGVDSSSDISVYIGVIDLVSDADYRSMMEEIMQKRSVKVLEEDLKTIDQYLANKDIDAEETPSGLRYIITEEGIGEKPNPGNEVQVHYLGYTLEGKVFDTSIESAAKENNMFNPSRDYSQPLSFPLGQGRVIKGWDEGIGLLNKGAKATLYIPSTLAYGEKGSGPIKPNSILIFEVELVDFK